MRFGDRFQGDRRLMTIGMFCFAAQGIIGMIKPIARLGENAVDGIHGALLGVAIGIMLLAFRRRSNCTTA